MLSNLTILDLANNYLRGNLTANDLPKNLKFLMLRGNQLTGIVPKKILELKDLEILSLDSNNFTELEVSGGAHCDELPLLHKRPHYFSSDCGGEVKCHCCTVCCNHMDSHLCSTGTALMDAILDGSSDELSMGTYYHRPLQSHLTPNIFRNAHL